MQYARNPYINFTPRKSPVIHIRTHNSDIKNRLIEYAAQHPDECRQTDADNETGCMAFEIRKGRFSIRLTAPYSEERRETAFRYAGRTRPPLS
ncbi:MAG: hypothetical protein GX111_08285 [Clostridiales bacterium]|jgi:hypothetical protein|nr:hypothetical protein [Clostridiales bacterium]